MSGQRDPWSVRRQARVRARAGAALAATVTAALGLAIGLNIVAGNDWAAWCLTAVLVAAIAGLVFGVWEDGS